MAVLRGTANTYVIGKWTVEPKPRHQSPGLAVASRTANH